MFVSLFGGGQRADLGDRSPWGGFWFEPLGMRSLSGERVTADRAMRLTAVFGSVRVRSETFASLPFKLYRPKAGGGREQLTDHWLVKLMARPNRWQTGFEWTEMVQAHLDLRGNAFNRMHDDGRGGIAALVPMHPDRVRAEAIDSDEGFRYKYRRDDGTWEPISRSQVWHIKGLSGDGICGYNPIEIAADVVGMGLASQSYAARFFHNDAKPGGWIEYDGKFTTPEDKKLFRDTWQKLQGGANRGKTAVLEKGFKYHELSVNHSDAQFLEQTKQTRSEIAMGIFRVPPHMIGELDRATYSNIEQQSLDFVNGCVLPMSERWESSLKTHLLLDADQELDVEFDFVNLLRGDMAARTAYYSGNIVNGSLTRNEARIMEGRNPLPGLDEPLSPMNMKGANEPTPALAPGGPAKPPEPQPVPSPKPRKKAEADERTVALATAAAERLARKEAREVTALVKTLPMDVDAITTSYAKHATVVRDALGVTEEAVAAYVAARRSDPIRAGHEEQDIYCAALAKLTTLALEGTL